MKTFRRRLAASLRVVATSAFALVSSAAFAQHEPMLRQYLAAYAAGDIAALPFTADAADNGLDARRVHADLFAQTADRSLTLHRVRWNDTRITADYTAHVDGADHAGSVTLYAEEGRIARIVHDEVQWAESAGYWSDAGQLADKGSTVVAMQAGATELNPILAATGPAGAVAMAAGMVALRQTVIKDRPLSECVAISRILGSGGWGLAASNLAVLAGSAAAPVVGLVAAALFYQADYKGECVDGEVRIAELPGPSMKVAQAANGDAWSESDSPGGGI
jgi:hypothetical protein